VSDSAARARDSLRSTISNRSFGRLARNSRSFSVLVLLNLAAFGLARLTGFARETVIADRFGTSHATDAYVAAIALPELMAGIFFGGLIGYTVIPKYVALRSRGDERGASELIGAAFNQVLLWCGGATLVGVVFAPWMLSFAAPGLHGDTRSHAIVILRITSVSVLLYGLTGLASAILNAREKFLPVPLGIVAGNLAALALLVATAASIGITAAGIAYVLAASVTTLILWILVLGSGGLGRLVLSFRNPRIGFVVRTGGIAMIVIGLPYFRYVMERAMASTQSTGDVAALGFATRTLFVAAALIAMPVGSVVFPRMAREAAEANSRALKRTVGRSLLLVLGLTIPVTALLVGFSRQLVAILFEHGAFGTDATATTASILRLYAIALGGLCLAELLVRVAFVVRAERTALICTVATFSLNVGVNFWLIGRLGVEAVAIGASVGIWLNVVLLGCLLFRRLQTVDGSIAIPEGH
jgi:putative peptidoglycan lipid II flippase